MALEVNREEPSAFSLSCAIDALQARKNGAIGGRGKRLDDRDIARGFNAF